MTIQLGGTAIAPVYSGPAPALPGVDQINFRIPDSGTLNGCYVSVIVKTGDIMSNEATIAKANQPGPCDHPLGLSAADMATLDAGGTISFGTVRLESDVGTVPGFSGGPARLETALAEFYPSNAFDIGLYAQPLTLDESYFGCQAATSTTIGVLRFLDDSDAGDALTLTGPGQSATLSRGVGIYQWLGSPFGTPLSDPPFFAPGSWRIEGPGGRTIGPFKADLMLPPVIHWTNRDNLTTIDRGQDQDVTWDPTGYTGTDVATVNLGQILCRAPAATGKLTIPSSLLAALPPRSAYLRLGIAARPNQRTLFSLPLTNGSTAQAFFDYSFSETISSQLSQ